MVRSIGFLIIFVAMISKLFVWLCVRWFNWKGWKIPKPVSSNLKQYVLVVVPHTSNVDFFVGIAARKLMNINVVFLAKKELFRFPFKRLFLNLGGFPVNREKNTSMVDYMTGIFKSNPDFAMCVAPEGTRSKVDKWKTGFYHIAVQAMVPIQMVGFDYPSKQILVAEPFMPSGDLEVDLLKMHSFFNKIVPKRPENSIY